MAVVNLPYPYVQIADVILATPAIWATNVAVLMGVGPLRGDDVTRVGVAGTSAQARLRHAWSVVLEPIHVFGDRNQDDLPYSDPVAGTDANLGLLRGLVAPLAAPGTRTLTLHLSASVTRTAAVTVERMGNVVTHTPMWVETALDLTIHAGVLA